MPRSELCALSNLYITKIWFKVKFILETRNSSELYGVIYFGFGIGSFVAPIISEFFIKKSTDYLVLFITTACLAFLSLILNLMLNTKRLDYNKLTANI